jgi:hypothetical protein
MNLAVFAETQTRESEYLVETRTSIVVLGAPPDVAHWFHRSLDRGDYVVPDPVTLLTESESLEETVPLRDPRLRIVDAALAQNGADLASGEASRRVPENRADRLKGCCLEDRYRSHDPPVYPGDERGHGEVRSDRLRACAYVETLVRGADDERIFGGALRTRLIEPVALRNDPLDPFIRDRAVNLLDVIERATGKQVTGRDSDETVAAFGTALMPGGVRDASSEVA